MEINFTKMQALGNDFMVVDAVRQAINLKPALIRQWASRQLGVGFDQLLLVEAATKKNADFIYRIFNADGNEVEQCGNGARCVARFVAQQGLSDKKCLHLQMQKGFITVELLGGISVKVDLGISKIEWNLKQLTVDEQPVELNCVSIGNPHAVVIVNDIDVALVEKLGPLIEKHEIFPNGINVGFMQVLNSKEIKLRVWERGVGETLACGSGACAAAIVGQQQQKLNDEVKVRLPGGDLHVIHRHEESIHLIGPAKFVYQGNISY